MQVLQLERDISECFGLGLGNAFCQQALGQVKSVRVRACACPCVQFFFCEPVL